VAAPPAWYAMHSYALKVYLWSSLVLLSRGCGEEGMVGLTLGLPLCVVHVGGEGEVA
jgi:hypothetical protein